MTAYGAIDIGTNSVRLLIGSISDQGRLIPIATRLTTTRLGEKMWERPLLREDAIRRTIKALQEYQEILMRHQVRKVRVVATSAVRDSLNQLEFVKRAKAEAGFAVEVITGVAEAKLGYAGVCWGTSSQEPIVMLDIGGGSTEFLFQNNAQIIAESIKLGAVRLTGSPLPKDQMLLLIKPIAEKLLAIPAGFHLIGVGGTVTTVVAVIEKLVTYAWDKVHGYRLSLKEIIKVREMLANLTLEERQKVPGLLPERADIIMAGIDILINVMEVLNKEEIEASEADILYGLILSLSLMAE